MSTHINAEQKKGDDFVLLSLGLTCEGGVWQPRILYLENIDDTKHNPECTFETDIIGAMRMESLQAAIDVALVFAKCVDENSRVFAYDTKNKIMYDIQELKTIDKAATYGL